MEERTKMIAIINGKVVTVTGQTFEKGTVLIEDGKIKACLLYTSS